MPTYRYHCAENGITVEVRHAMADSVDTWGELCERVGRALGDTRADAPVHRIISGGILALSRRERRLPPYSETTRPDSCLPMDGPCACKEKND